MRTIKLTEEELSRMKKVREEKGFTQSYMAEKLCLSETAYQKYEKGKRDIPEDALFTINSVLGLTTSEISPSIWRREILLRPSFEILHDIGPEDYTTPEFFEQFYPQKDEIDRECAWTLVELLKNILVHYGDNPDVMGGFVYVQCVQNLLNVFPILEGVIGRIKIEEEHLCRKTEVLELYSAFLAYPKKVRESILGFVQTKLIKGGFIITESNPYLKRKEEKVPCVIEDFDLESFSKIFADSEPITFLPTCSPCWVFDGTPV